MIVLPVRRCQMAGAMGAPGTRIHGCSYRVPGRCLIIRVDDPGVARHELATAGSIQGRDRSCTPDNRQILIPQMG